MKISSLLKIRSLMITAYLTFLFIPFNFALIDILKNEFTGNDKLIWIVAVLYAPVIVLVESRGLQARQVNRNLILFKHKSEITTKEIYEK